MNEYRQTAEAIIAAVGGKENIAAATHCATRLRMVLKDENKIDKAAIDTVPPACAWCSKTKTKSTRPPSTPSHLPKATSSPPDNSRSSSAPAP